MLKKICVLVLVVVVDFRWHHQFLVYDAETTVYAEYRQDMPATLDMVIPENITTLDPALVDNLVSANVVENLFLGLTDVDPFTRAIRPEMATHWDVNSDGTIWTFYLHSDVMWIQYNDVSQTATEVRPVVAGDFVYGIKRGCDPRVGGYYRRILAEVIKGCDVVNEMPANLVTDELTFGETIAVSAPDDTTLVVELQYPTGYFLSMTPMWMLRAVPQETIESFGDEWTAPENIMTNGHYYVKEMIDSVRSVFVRNHALALQLVEQHGNIEVINISIFDDEETIFALYSDKEIDITPIPKHLFQDVLTTQAPNGEIARIAEPTLFFLVYNLNTPPFNNVHVRRAFSAVIDRDKFISEIFSGNGIVATDLTSDAIVLGEDRSNTSIGFDPNYAQAEMRNAGYDGCEGFPQIKLIRYQLGNREWLEFLAESAVNYLGCDPTIFEIEEVQLPIGPDPSFNPYSGANIWIDNFEYNLPDVYEGFQDIISCQNQFFVVRSCNEVDNLINAASIEIDATSRNIFYAEINSALFGETGEFPIVPLAINAKNILAQSWYTGPFETDGVLGMTHWDAYSLDMASKLSAKQ